MVIYWLRPGVCNHNTEHMWSSKPSGFFDQAVEYAGRVVSSIFVLVLGSLLCRFDRFNSEDNGIECRM